jgi:sigma-B regulation protein RsbU (phosphoserine phosphatase)
MAHVNRMLGQNLPDSMFVTFFLALFDPASGTLRYVNAGHLPPMMLAGGGQVSPLGSGNQPVGVMEGRFREDSARIPDGAAMVVVTDGITESAAPGGGQLGLSGLESVLEQLQFLSADELAQRVVQAAAQFRQTLPQHDDVTVLALMRHGADKEATQV